MYRTVTIPEIQKIMPHEKSPGISRQQRISDEGLARLEKQLLSGVRLSSVVLAQWVKRYGDSARELKLRHGQSYQEVDNDD